MTINLSGQASLITGATGELGSVIARSIFMPKPAKPLHWLPILVDKVDEVDKVDKQ
jgi:FlaA1/EpsC-like NDP-sugar epimerase